MYDFCTTAHEWWTEDTSMTYAVCFTRSRANCDDSAHSLDRAASSGAGNGRRCKACCSSSECNACGGDRMILPVCMAFRDSKAITVRKRRNSFHALSKAGKSCRWPKV